MYGMGQGLSFIAKPLRDKFYYRSHYGSNLRVCKIIFGVKNTLFKKINVNNLQVMLHHFSSFPSFDESEIYAPLGKETNLEIESEYNTADEKVQQLPIAARDCVFGWELGLQHFPVYRY